MKARTLSLNGKWTFITDPKSSFSFEEVEDKFLNKTCPKTNIPSNWELEGLSNFSGSVWFYKTLSFHRKDDKLFLLEFNGVDYFADVYLNGKFIGHHEGYFQKFYIDVSETLSGAKTNHLFVRVTSPFEEPGKVWPLKKKLIKGIFNHHDCRPGGWDLERGQDKNTGGIWNDINLIAVKSSYITNLRIQSRLNEDNSKALIKVIADFITNLIEPETNIVNIELKSPEGKILKYQKEVYLDSVTKSFSFVVEVENPKLWWTWDLGGPNLYQINFEGESIPFTEESFGIREVSLDDQKVFYLNGKKLFLRGTNVIPEQFLSRLTEKKIERQVKMIREANLNIIRMHAHVNRKEYYDRCDRAGILVWQDFALQWTYDESPEFIENASKQISDMVKLNFNHPSIAFWCCHNEPGEQIKTLDPFLYDAVLSIDNSRIVRLASNYEEHPYDGWYWGNKEHFAACPMGPIVTEFGAQALPALSSLKKIMNDEEINEPIWGKWKYHNFQYEQTFHIAKIERGETVCDFINNSQQYQADYIRTAVDFYRREKFNKVSGIFQFMFIDCWESVSWSVVDFYERKKPGYYALQKSMQPLYVSVKVMRDTYFAGQKLMIDLWIINDLHKKFSNCKVKLLIRKKLLGTMDIDIIEPNSVKKYFWESYPFILPQKIYPGTYKIMVKLLDDKNGVLSQNDFDIVIDNSVE